MHVKHNSTSEVKNVYVLALSNPILLGRVSTRRLMYNTIARTSEIHYTEQILKHY